GGDADHLLDEVDAGDELGDRMLDLQARVHLQEVERAVLAGDELHRAGAVVAHRLGQRHGLLAHRLARPGIEQRRGRLLDHLLIAALDGAFALAQVDDVAVLVAQHLDLDVARVLDELLDEDAVVAEARLGLRAGEREALLGLLRRVGDAHALAAAAGRGLDHHRIADLRRDPERLLGIGDLAEVAGNGGDLGAGGGLLALDLVAHGGDGPRIGTDENDAGLLQCDGKRLALGEEAVARVHGLRARLLAGFHDLVDQQVGLGGRRRADSHGLVRHLDVQAVAVCLRVDGHGLDAEPVGASDDPAGDLAAVGDQDFLEHACPWRRGRARAACAAVERTTDAMGQIPEWAMIGKIGRRERPNPWAVPGLPNRRAPGGAGACIAGAGAKIWRPRLPNTYGDAKLRPRRPRGCRISSGGEGDAHGIPVQAGADRAPRAVHRHRPAADRGPGAAPPAGSDRGPQRGRRRVRLAEDASAPRHPA